jgi:hypothetical protein
MLKYTSCVAALLLVGGLAIAAEVSSGLPKGEFVPAFTVTDITGPSKGKDLCYRCQYGSRPVVSIFTKELTPAVAKLTKAVDETVAKNKDAKMAAFVVLLSDEPTKAAPALEEAAAKQQIKHVPLTTFESAKGPGGYKLNADADVTVMMWVDSEITVSKGFKKDQLNDDAIAQLIADTKTILE